MTGGKLDRSILQGESFELFSAAIRSPSTRDPYERKLLGLLAHHRHHQIMGAVVETGNK